MGGFNSTLRLPATLPTAPASARAGVTSAAPLLATSASASSPTLTAPLLLPARPLLLLAPVAAAFPSPPSAASSAASSSAAAAAAPPLLCPTDALAFVLAGPAALRRKTYLFSVDYLADSMHNV